MQEFKCITADLLTLQIVFQPWTLAFSLLFLLGGASEVGVYNRTGDLP